MEIRRKPIYNAVNLLITKVFYGKTTAGVGIITAKLRLYMFFSTGMSRKPKCLLCHYAHAVCN